MQAGSSQRRSNMSDLVELIFDGSSVTAATRETSAAISLKGFSASTADIGKLLAVTGGTNFIVGGYRIVSIDAGSNTWTLNRPCTDGAGHGMTGKIVKQNGKRYEPVKEFYDQDQPENPGRGEAQQQVLKALNLLESEVLKSLADICLKKALLEPAMPALHDWPGPLGSLDWGHIRDAGRIESMGVIFGNLKPLRTALMLWAKDEPLHRWNLCDGEGELLDWVADAAVQTLVWWQRKDRLPKGLSWKNINLHCYGSLESEDSLRMLELEQDFDAGSGYIPIAPDSGVHASRLSYRQQRTALKEYESLGQKLGLARMTSPSARYFEWYAMHTFLGSTLQQVREHEFKTPRKGGTGLGVGDPRDPNDLSAVSHGIKKIADLIGFRR
jgi:hypothetical protein